MVIVPSAWCEPRSHSQCWEAATEGSCGHAGSGGARTAGSRGGWLSAAALVRCTQGPRQLPCVTVIPWHRVQCVTVFSVSFPNVPSV